MIRSIFEHHGRLLAIEAGMGAMINCAIAAGVSWATFHPAVLQSMWGPGGFGPDALLASFAPAFMISLLAGLAQRGKVANGRLGALPTASQAHGLHAAWLHFMPARALVCALLVTLCLAPPLMLAIAAVGPARLDFDSYLAIKCAHGAVVGAVCGVMALGWALIDSASPKSRQSPAPASIG